MNNPDSAYKAAIKTREHIDKLHQEISEQQHIYASQIQEYRIASVSRILDHIRSEYRRGKICNLEILLCHCQNKLYGNIDGVELDLHDRHRGIPFETKSKEAEQALKQLQEGE